MYFELLRVISTNYYGYEYSELLLSTVYIFNPLNLQMLKKCWFFYIYPNASNWHKSRIKGWKY